MQGTSGSRPREQVLIASNNNTRKGALAGVGSATAYLLLSLPAGICYFVLLVLFFALSIGLVIIWLGIPIFIAGLYLCWQCAIFERNLTMRWLHCEITPLALAPPTDQKWLARLRAHLSNAMTWKTMVFLLLKFPLGILSFVLVINIFVVMIVLTLLACILGFLCIPFLYLGIVIWPTPLVLRRPGQSAVTIDGMGSLLGFLLLGVRLVAIKLPGYLILGLAWIWQQLGRALLGMNSKDLRLAQAEAQVRSEHAKAERAELSRQQLITNVSHELRTPVASIRAHLEVLLNACEQQDASVLNVQQLSNYLSITHQEAVRLGALVEDLFSLSRTEADKLRLNMASVQAGEIVEQVYQSLLPLARKERMITLVRSLPSTLPLVQADARRLAQILTNLVRNAITYTPNGGIISLSAQPEQNSYLVITIADTGIGIAADQLPLIFERFYRTDESRARSSGGAGLGLSIVKDLVDAMGGYITVESQPGEGSCFFVHLRLAQNITAYNQQASQPLHQRGPGR